MSAEPHSLRCPSVIASHNCLWKNQSWQSGETLELWENYLIHNYKCGVIFIDYIKLQQYVEGFHPRSNAQGNNREFNVETEGAPVQGTCWSFTTVTQWWLCFDAQTTSGAKPQYKQRFYVFLVQGNLLLTHQSLLYRIGRLVLALWYRMPARTFKRPILDVGHLPCHDDWHTVCLQCIHKM